MKVVGHGVRALLRLPFTDAPVPSMPGLDADMLDGATLILDPEVIERWRKQSVQAARGRPVQ